MEPSFNEKVRDRAYKNLEKANELSDHLLEYFLPDDIIDLIRRMSVYYRVAAVGLDKVIDNISEGINR